MLKFVSSFDDLKDFEDRNTYYLRIRIHPNYTENKTLALDTYLQKLRFFLLDVSRHIQPCVDDDWSWVDYLKREKKIVQYSLMREFDSVLHQIAKGNESNDIQVLLNAIMDGKALDVRKFQFSYTHKLRLLDTDYADEKFDRLEIYFDLLRKEPDKKPYYSKQDLIELIRLAYKHYPVDSITLADGNFDMRSPSSSDYYEGSYAVFPHRRTCAWMIGLPHKIGQSDIPDTAEAIDINGKNTLVVSNRDEWFTSFNAEHVQKANFLEIALWEKGLLPVF